LADQIVASLNSAHHLIKILVRWFLEKEEVEVVSWHESLNPMGMKRTDFGIRAQEIGGMAAESILGRSSCNDEVLIFHIQYPLLSFSTSRSGQS
jgi:hypothetical protein